MAVKPIPDQYYGVTPYLIIRDAAKAIEFYKKAFGATELMRMDGPGGRLWHAELQISKGRLMLADEAPEMGIRGPQTFGGTGVTLLAYFEDVDATFKQVVDAGAKVVRPLMDQFYGDRSATVEDPFGHVWTIASHKEDLTQEELHKRTLAMRKE